MENGAAWDGHAKHLLQTQRPGAKLRVVIFPFAAFADFELHRKKRAVAPHPICDHPLPTGWVEGRGEGMDFHDVALTGQAKPF